ncbi:MAG: hypothetical protein MJE77_40535 [Proteobacteria bacterium]|nr:hypothetical protein [Pseudomonadota bacterium]
MRTTAFRLSVGAVSLYALITAPWIQSTAASGDDRTGKSRSARTYVQVGTPTTGLNRALGLPVWRFPQMDQFVPLFGPFVPLIGFNTSGHFDPVLGPGNGNSPPLSPTTPGNALIASHFDAFGLSFTGISPGSVPDEVLNVPVDDTAVLVDDFGVRNEPVPCASEVDDPAVISRAGPCSEGVTLGQWMSAWGISRTRCRADGTAQIRINVRKLRPNRMYSIWLIVEDFDGQDPASLIRPIPFGGVPNIFVTDKRGSATWVRELGFCPQTDPRVLNYVIVNRANGQNYGGVPAPFLNQEDPDTAFDGYRGFIPGTVAQVQLSFNVGGIPVDPSDVPPLPLSLEHH